MAAFEGAFQAIFAVLWIIFSIGFTHALYLWSKGTCNKKDPEIQ